MNDICGGELLKGGPSEWNTPIWEHDLEKGLAFSQGHELAAFGATAVAVTPGWLRSEMMLDNYLVTEDSWRDALDQTRAERGHPVPPSDFAHSESPRYVGRAVVSLALNPDRNRWNQQSVSSGQLAREYGFTDLDGTRPDIWARMRNH